MSAYTMYNMEICNGEDLNLAGCDIVFLGK